MSVPARTSYISAVTWCTPSSTYCSRGFSGMCPRLQMIPMALLSGTQPAGFLQDPHSWDCTHHTTKPLLFQDRQLQRPFEDTTASPSVGSLEVTRKLLQNWTHFYSVSAQTTGLQWLGRDYPMEATKTKWLDHVYSTHDVYQHSTELLMKWPEPEPYPKIQARRQLTEIPHRHTKCLKQLQATFPNTSTSHAAHPYNFECYLNACIPSGNHKY